MPRSIGEPMDMSQTPVARRTQEQLRADERTGRATTAATDGGANRMQQPRPEPRTAEDERTRPAAIVEIEQPAPRVRDEQPETPTPQPVNPARGSINITA